MYFVFPYFPFSYFPLWFDVLLFSFSIGYLLSPSPFSKWFIYFHYSLRGAQCLATYLCQWILPLSMFSMLQISIFSLQFSLMLFFFWVYLVVMNPLNLSMSGKSLPYYLPYNSGQSFWAQCFQLIVYFYSLLVCQILWANFWTSFLNMTIVFLLLLLKILFAFNNLIT